MGLFHTLYGALEAQFGDLTPLMLLGGIGLVLIMIVLPMLLIKPAEPFDKVKSQRMGRDQRETRPARAENTLRREEKADKLQKFATFLEPQNVGSWTRPACK